MTRHLTVRDAIAGGMWGLLIGDALGVPYEFHDASRLGTPGVIDMPPPSDFARSHAHAPPRAWSDDGAQALCLLASLLECGGLDLDDLGRRLLQWFDAGSLAVGGIVFDVGIQTQAALAALKRRVPAETAGPSGERDNGNGSLMRVLPLALWHRGSDDALVRDAARQSRVTHGHLRAQLCCAFYCLWVRAALEGVDDAWRDATQRLRGCAAGEPDWLLELEAHIQLDREPSGSGSGYVVDGLHSARLAARETSFERVVRAAVALGNDTDTTAAVAGGFAGVRHGLSGIPERWRAALSGRPLADPLVVRLVERGAARSFPTEPQGPLR